MGRERRGIGAQGGTQGQSARTRARIRLYQEPLNERSQVLCLSISFGEANMQRFLVQSRPRTPRGRATPSATAPLCVQAHQEPL